MRRDGGSHLQDGFLRGPRSHLVGVGLVQKVSKHGPIGCDGSYFGVGETCYLSGPFP